MRQLVKNVQDPRVGDGDEGTTVVRNKKFGSITSSGLKFDRLDQPVKL
jgi:hypothetical protein